ncbi:MAG: PadR family transcriptional regulator [Candidatus Gastranaerophilales bacterium]
MIEMLVLFAISKRDLTMYAVHKFIENNFAPFTKPSFGAINPALKRLIDKEFLTSRKSMSDGGKLSVFYSITNSGIGELKKIILADYSENPIQFMPNAKIRLSCACVLDEAEKNRLFLMTKKNATKHKNIAEAFLSEDFNQFNFYQKIVVDNTICELKNFINIVEGFEKDNVSNS